MKCFSYFIGKGGVGKTTLKNIAASYFAYAKQMNVKVVDKALDHYTKHIK